MGSLHIQPTQPDTIRITILNDVCGKGSFPYRPSRSGTGEDSTGLTSTRRGNRWPARFEKFRRKRTRLLTTLVVLGLCSVAVLRGWSIVRFVDLRVHLGSGEKAAVSIRSWVGIPGIGSAALQGSLTQLTDATDIDGARKRADDLSALLSVRPLSPVNWLSLSGMRLVGGQNEKEVLSALEMSWVTGPNEGSIMLERGVFGLVLWEVLPTNDRKRVIDDLAGAILGTPIYARELDVAKTVLSTKSLDIREEITSLMRAQSVSATQLARLGL